MVRLETSAPWYTPHMPAVYTIGHSTRPVEEFVSILLQRSVNLLADVRTIPRSRHNPQFNTDILPTVLAEAGIGYLHLKELGGLRRPRPDSPNCGWENASFRGYADYMQTEEFAAAMRNLLDLTQRETLALMCAEAVPWRCHRSLIADALSVRGVQVVHLISAGEGRPHQLTRFARVEGEGITYPGAC